MENGRRVTTRQAKTCTERKQGFKAHLAHFNFVKVCEDFVVEKLIKPAVLEIVDPHQFGTVPESSTNHALISVVHYLTSVKDGNGCLARLALFDFRKAFDLIDHHLLVQKLYTLNIPLGVIKWVSDFLTARQQRVKLGPDCYSEWSNVPAGVPQRTKLGPWLFALMINDLDPGWAKLWKFVDDSSTAAESVLKGDSSNMQSIVNRVKIQSDDLKFTLKLMWINAKKYVSNFPKY